jgi:hypothetical protein
MITNYNSLREEIRMLEGNINRICVTDDLEEVNAMYDWAKRRLDAIFNYNKNRLKK